MKVKQMCSNPVDTVHKSNYALVIKVGTKKFHYNRKLSIRILNERK
jgi:hypothetical protein